MPDLRIGTTSVGSARIGTGPVTKLYVGTTQVWPTGAPPAAPVNLVAVPTGTSTEAALTWDAVSGATGYVVEYRKTKVKSVTFSDEFDYPDGSNLGTVSPVWVQDGGPLIVTGGKISSVTLGEDSLVIGPTPATGDGFTEITFQNGGGSYVGCQMRNRGGSRTEISAETNPANGIQIAQFFNESETILDVTPNNFFTLNQTYRMRLECIGLIARIYLDDVLILAGQMIPAMPLNGYVRTGQYRGGVLTTERFEMGTYTVGTFAQHSTPTGNSATITGLLVGEQYDFRVAAVNNAGTGAWSTIDPVVPGLGLATIASVTPSSGTTNGGLTITVTGTNFVPDATSVTFDNGTPIAAAVRKYNSLEFTSPVHAAGASQLRVVTPNGASAPFTFTFVAPPASVIKFVDSAFTPVNFSSGATVTFPFVPENGQFIMVWSGDGATTPTVITPPAGFTSVGPWSNDGSSMHTRLFWKIANNEASASYTFTWAQQGGRLMASLWTNVHATTPLDVAVVSTNGWQLMIAPATTNVTTGVMHIAAVMAGDQIYNPQFPLDYFVVNPGAPGQYASGTFRVMAKAFGAPGVIPAVQIGEDSGTLRMSAVLRPTATPISDTAPRAPTNLSAGPLHASVALSWAPKFNGGAPLTDWSVQYRTTAGPGTWTSFDHVASVINYITVTGLTNGTSYDFQVAGINSVGLGTYSAATTTTPTADGPGVQFHDEFNRADAETLGANWLHESVHTWSRLGIINMEMSGTNATESLGLYATPAGSTDQYAEVSKWEGSGECGLVICASNTVGNFNDGYRITSRNWGTTVTLYKNSATLANWNAAAAGTQAYHRFRLQRAGNVITAYRDGALLGTYTDSTSPLTGQYFGLNVQGANNGLPRLDNFRGGEL